MKAKFPHDGSNKMAGRAVSGVSTGIPMAGDTLPLVDGRRLILEQGSTGVFRWYREERDGSRSQDYPGTVGYVSEGACRVAMAKAQAYFDAHR